MIHIRKLQHGDMAQAIILKLSCWPEELAGLSQMQLDFETELTFWLNWMNTARENNDVRLLYGAFDGDELLGAAFGSFVASRDLPENGFELNGLWVYPQHRGNGISLRLLLTLLDDFDSLGAKKLVVYNFHFAPSNQFYRKFGCRVIDSEHQTEDHVPTDIFSCGIAEMRSKISHSLASRAAGALFAESAPQTIRGADR